MVKSKTPHRKHVPMRTCIVCRQVRGKRDLIRVVRTPESTVQIDETGKHAGRGAYLCRARPCWDQALARQRLAAALKTTLSADDTAALKEYAARLPEAVASES